ncbi:MAG: hypothetical protein RI987_1051, partial [Actinomycetota bacterium]
MTTSNATIPVQHGMAEHSHGAGIPVQTRSERLRSANVADFAPVSKREEQYRYVSSEQLAGLDADALDEYVGDISIKHPDGVTTAWVGSDHPAFGAAGLPEDRPSAAAWGSAQQAYLVTIPGDAKPDCEIQIGIGSESESPSALHVIIEAKPFSRGTVVLDHKGDAVLGENVEIIVGDEADIT